MRNREGKKKFIIGDYLFYVYTNWAGPNFLPLTVYYKLYIRSEWNLTWSVMLEFKGDEIIAWDKFKCPSAYKFDYNIDNNTHIIGEDQQNNIWTGTEKLNPDDNFFKKAYPLIEPELQNIRAEIIIGK